MTPTELSIAAAREHLAEARRWCRTRPEAAKAGMASASRLLWEIKADDGARLTTNLRQATTFILACPAMAEGYIDGALFELLAYGDRLRRAREAEGEGADG